MDTSIAESHEENKPAFELELHLISHAAVDFYIKNEDRLGQVTLNEYSNHAIDFIDKITNEGDVDEDIEALSDMMDITSAAMRAKGNIAYARNTVEDETDQPKAARMEGGFWWFYKQVVAYTMETAAIINTEHKKTRPTLEIYDHFVDVRFELGAHSWLYKVEIKDHKEIKIVGFINNEVQTDHSLLSGNGSVYFLLNKTARMMALDKAVSYAEYMASESPVAKRAKAVAILLNGDFKKNKAKKRLADELELLRN